MSQPVRDRRKLVDRSQRVKVYEKQSVLEQLMLKKFSSVKCSNADVSIFSTQTKELENRFESDLLTRASKIIASKPNFVLPPRKTKLHKPHHVCSESPLSSSSCSSSSCSSDEDEENTAFEELERKKLHPWRLHEELWFNDPGEMNDGPLCRCSAKAKRSGIRHGIYPEEKIFHCQLDSNNADHLYHYRLNISPLTNYISKFPTTIEHENNEYLFEGFSILSHSPILNYPPCKLIRFNIEYTITLVEEEFPSNFSVRGVEMITEYIFKEILELVDLNWHSSNGTSDSKGCPQFHLFPRFSRHVDDDGKELLSLNAVMNYLLAQSGELIKESDLKKIQSMNDSEWLDFVDTVRGMIVTFPGMKPCSLRVDQIDKNNAVTNGDSCSSETKAEDDGFPVIVHFGIRPPQLSYAGNPKYQKAWRDYVKFRHLLANKPKVSYCDRQTLLQKEEKLQDMRTKNDLKRDVTVVISSKGFHKTGIFCDVIQHALLIPVVICHLRFHQSLAHLEEILGYPFKDRYLLQLALTHPSYRENFGTNPDHARNALTNCGIRQPHYGDRRVHFMNTRKRGINMLINIMSRFGCPEETASNINHNERLEFLGDAVVEFLSSIHLYFIFPDLEEGGLATYRAAIVQNQHLAVLAKKLQLEKYMLYAHGSDLCHDIELRHAMANCFEALMGALFLDGGIKEADQVFSNTLFKDEPDLYEVWISYPPHPLQQQASGGDRMYLKAVPRLQELREFEEMIGIEFTHIRLLARAFTHRSVGFNNLTLGSNQRMEFLGDTVLQLVASEYLYKYFPEHHEGHLSLLRSSLVNNKTQAVVCDDLGMTRFAVFNYAKGELKTKDRADLLEAFLGALYVDKGLEYCRRFCEVCFFPRLEDFIMNQDWNDPKSKLQQCCLTLRSIDGGEPDIPIYKVIESLGPTNTRVYKVAVYFRDKRLATGKGHSIQEAEMDAASNALDNAKGLFPQLNHQRRVMERSFKT
ncbi:ribonuclease 3 [Tetranychus urticae]|uniref:Ribonuclease 3 n=1 Tax=Tetranychus urticae TaxID=32264 RepID=T1KIC9_TETUR|nr:ribonuclease 3 [Tetranychus urticae]